MQGLKWKNVPVWELYRSVVVDRVVCLKCVTL